MTKLSKAAWLAKLIEKIPPGNKRKLVQAADQVDIMDDLLESVQWMPVEEATVDPEAMDFTDNEIFDIIDQAAEITLAVAAGEPGIIKMGYFNPNGDTINVPANFKEMLGTFAYMAANPDTNYLLVMIYVTVDGNNEVWCFIPQAITAGGGGGDVSSSTVTDIEVVTKAAHTALDPADAATVYFING